MKAKLIECLSLIYCMAPADYNCVMMVFDDNLLKHVNMANRCL